jgi:hypothetical protein
MYSPPPPPAPPPAGAPAAQQVQGPAMGLLITGIIGVLLNLIGLAMNVLGAGMSGLQNMGAAAAPPTATCNT